MDTLFQLLILILLSLVLLWLGVAFFFRKGNLGTGDGGVPQKRYIKARRNEPGTAAYQKGGAGSPQSCPVCGLLLPHGELVKSSVFPDPGNGQGRLMHITGCVHCLEGRRTGKRRCPVCGTQLGIDEVLFARIFDKPGRSHVHVLGCSQCRGPGSKRNTGGGLPVLRG